MTVESMTVPAITACFVVPSAALYVRTVGITRILERVSAATYAASRAYKAFKAEYRTVYRRTVMEMESER